MHWVSAEPECGLISTPEYGTHGLTCYYPGTTNLIISVPHGGEMRPPFIADRQRPTSGKLSTSEGSKLTKLTKEENPLMEEGNKLLKEESKKEERKLTKEENTLTKEGSKSTKEESKSTREENKSAKEGIKLSKKGSRLMREESCDPDEDTAGRITTAADIYTQVRKHPPLDFKGANTLNFEGEVGPLKLTFGIILALMLLHLLSTLKVNIWDYSSTCCCYIFYAPLN